VEGRREAPPGAEGTEAVYDRIATAWAATRRGPWPEVLEFLKGLKRPARVADVGVGAGRYLGVREAEGLWVVGLDRSRGQLAEAKRVGGARGGLLRADARAIPLRDASVEGLLCIAVVHHLKAREERVAMMREVGRVLRPGGGALLSGWGTHAKAFEGARRAEGGGPQDFLVPFKEGLATPAWRFFHAYGEGELAAEAGDAGLKVRREWEGGENRFLEVER